MGLYTDRKTLNLLNFSGLRWESFHVAQFGLELPSSSNYSLQPLEYQNYRHLKLGPRVFSLKSWVALQTNTMRKRVGQSSWQGNKPRSWALNYLLCEHVCVCAHEHSSWEPFLSAVPTSLFQTTLLSILQGQVSQQFPTQAVSASRSNSHPQVPGCQKK